MRIYNIHNAGRFIEFGLTVNEQIFNVIQSGQAKVLIVMIG